MLQSTASRIRLCISALGCAVLGASLFNWAQALHAERNQFTWVEVNSSNAPPADTAEIWQAPASCVRRYFVRALLRSEARLKAYYDLAPKEVRARLDRSPDIPQPAGSARWYRLVKSNPDSAPVNNDDLDMEYAAQLHVQYAEWYANVFKLEIEESQWQQRLADVADQRLIFSEAARKSFRAYSGHAVSTASPAGGFDDHVLSTLGLGGFPSDEEQALKSDCVKISLVKKTFKDPHYLGALWRWPVDQTAAFAFGLEFILISIFLVPITLWIGTGDSQIARQHIRDAANRLAAKANRLAAKVRNFDRDKFISDALERARPACMRARAVLLNLGSAANRQVRIFLRMAASPNFTMTSTRWGDAETSGKRSFTWPPRPFPKYRPRW